TTSSLAYSSIGTPLDCWSKMVISTSRTLPAGEAIARPQRVAAPGRATRAAPARVHPQRRRTAAAPLDPPQAGQGAADARAASPPQAPRARDPSRGASVTRVRPSALRRRREAAPGAIPESEHGEATSPGAPGALLGCLPADGERQRVPGDGGPPALPRSGQHA